MPAPVHAGRHTCVSGSARCCSQTLVEERLLCFQSLPTHTLEAALRNPLVPQHYPSYGLLRLATALRGELTRTRQQLDHVKAQVRAVVVVVAMLLWCAVHVTMPDPRCR